MGPAALTTRAPPRFPPPLDGYVPLPRWTAFDLFGLRNWLFRSEYRSDRFWFKPVDLALAASLGAICDAWPSSAGAVPKALLTWALLLASTALLLVYRPFRPESAWMWPWKVLGNVILAFITALVLVDDVAPGGYAINQATRAVAFMVLVLMAVFIAGVTGGFIVALFHAVQREAQEEDDLRVAAAINSRLASHEDAAGAAAAAARSLAGYRRAGGGGGGGGGGVAASGVGDRGEVEVGVAVAEDPVEDGGGGAGGVDGRGGAAGAVARQTTPYKAGVDGVCEERADSGGAAGVSATDDAAVAGEVGVLVTDAAGGGEAGVDGPDTATAVPASLTDKDAPVDGVGEAGEAAQDDAAVDAAVDASVGASVGAAVDATMDASVGAAVDAAVNASAGAAVDAAVGAAVDAAVNASAGAAVDAAVDASVGATADAASCAAVDSVAGTSMGLALDASADAAVEAGERSNDKASAQTRSASDGGGDDGDDHGGADDRGDDEPAAAGAPQASQPGLGSSSRSVDAQRGDDQAVGRRLPGLGQGLASIRNLNGAAARAAGGARTAFGPAVAK